MRLSFIAFTRPLLCDESTSGSSAPGYLLDPTRADAVSSTIYHGQDLSESWGSRDKRTDLSVWAVVESFENLIKSEPQGRRQVKDGQENNGGASTNSEGLGRECPWLTMAIPP
jgi:hypothetical protein